MGPERSQTCPTDDVLGAHVERALAGAEAEHVTAHLDECAGCRAIVIAAIKARADRAPVGTMPTATPARRRVPRATLIPSGPGTVGARVGRYEIRGLIGAGGMGEVYEAYDGELERAIALKVMRPELVAPGVLAARLVRESRMMARLAHPSVIAVHDVGRVDGGDAVFIAMELIRGETLGAYVRRVRPGWRELVGLLERAGNGLAAAHAAGILHRDFKPDNVLVELSGAVVTRVVVTDFGVARSIVVSDDSDVTPVPDTRSVELTRTGTAVGTPAYMSPEQLAGQPLDARSDVFAFAVSAWELAVGQRPFPGKTVDELRSAMAEPPRGERSRIPARLVRVLERGLATRPEDRWPSQDAFVQALAAVPRRRGRGRFAIASVIGATAGLVVLAGGLANNAADDPPDPCAHGLSELADAYDRPAVFDALAGDPIASTRTLAVRDRAAAAWRDTHAATCDAEARPPQPASTAACLDARRIELAGIADDLRFDGPAHAIRLVDLLGDPSACRHPGPGMVVANVPEDPTRRRAVTMLRYRAFDVEAARDRGELRQALAAAAEIAREARASWPRVHAEALYLLGTTQAQGGSNTLGHATLREAAAVAERASHDYIAANAWIQLVQGAGIDAGDVDRAFEFLAHAEAVVARMGDHPNLQVQLAYVRGATLVQAHRNAEGEVVLREALARARRRAPELLPLVIQGFGYVLEGHGRYDEAVAMYREALSELATRGGNPSTESVFRGRLAQCLAVLGKTDEAEAQARRAVAIADRILDDTNLDRAIAHANLAEALEAAGRLEPALAEAELARTSIGAIAGERSERYAEALVLVGTIQLDLERTREADATLARACEIHAFALGDASATLAECYQQRAIARSELGDLAGALALAEKVLAIFVATYDESHPQVGNAYVIRGALHAELGDHARAIPDLERAVAAFAKQPLDPGHHAAAEWALGRSLHAVGRRARGRRLVEQARSRFAGAGATWAATAAEVVDWLRAHPS